MSGEIKTIDLRDQWMVEASKAILELTREVEFLNPGIRLGFDKGVVLEMAEREDVEAMNE